ncbi:MAG: dihydroneopterin aldolase [Chitinophagaceae bacterium]
MSGLITIELIGLRFFSAIGVYAEENLVQNEFEVDVLMDIPGQEEVITSIKDTVNYLEAANIVRKEMQQPHKLMETCAMIISKKIKSQYPQVEKVFVKIQKLSPPINNFIGKVSVSYTS